MQQFKTREEWLHGFHHEFVEPLFKRNNHKVPEKIRMSCGWPSRGGTGKGKRTIGECWYPENTADGSYQLFISPVRANPLDVAETLIHEVAHTVAGFQARHGRGFKQVAESVGLTGKMTATQLAEPLRIELEGFFGAYAAYPHGGISLTGGLAVPKQSTRMLKAFCPGCLGSDHEYTIRLSRKVADLGLPKCPACQEFDLFLEGSEEDEDGE